jgi:hypothetical protein
MSKQYNPDGTEKVNVGAYIDELHHKVNTRNNLIIKLENQSTALTARIAELEDYIDQHNAKVIAELDNAARIAELEAALENMVTQFAGAAETQDDMDVLRSARATLAGEE